MFIVTITGIRSIISRTRHASLEAAELHVRLMREMLQSGATYDIRHA